MTTNHNFLTQIASYKGFLGWNAFVDGSGVTRPATEVELFIKEHPIPVRRPKVTEVYAKNSIDPMTQYDTGFKAIFYGQPDLLQIQLSGWIITPITSSAWVPADLSGTPLSYAGNISYAEVINNYITGEYNQTSAGAFQRKDPDYYTSPHGQVWTNPIIASWEPEYTVNRRKQAFTLTLWLEK